MTTSVISQLNPASISLIENTGLTIMPLDPIGIEVRGADVREELPESVIEALSEEMAVRGFVVFKG